MMMHRFLYSFLFILLFACGCMDSTSQFGEDTSHSTTTRPKLSSKKNTAPKKSVDLPVERVRSPERVFKMVAPYLPQNPVILEGGAYDGSDTVRMATFWPNGTIYSFEPVPELFHKTRQNTAAHKNITVYDLALSDEVGTTEFHLSEKAEEPGIPSRSGSLLQPKEHKKIWPTIVFEKKIEVETTTLDAWAAHNSVNHIDFMWLDVQGVELPVMKGAPRMMKTVKALYLEVEFVELYEKQALYKDIQSWLGTQGFTMIGTDFDKNKGPSNKAYGNAIFVRK